MTHTSTLMVFIVRAQAQRFHGEWYPWRARRAGWIVRAVVPLFWRVFAIDVVLLVTGVVLLLVTPARVSPAVTTSEAAILLAGALCLLAARFVLLRRAFRSLRDLTERLRRVDPRVIKRLPVGGSPPEVATVAAAFNTVLSSLEDERRARRTVVSGRMSEVTYETVELTREGRVATIRLNRPDSLNALNGQMGAELRDAIFEVSSDDDVRAVLLTGAGRGFSAGADLKDASPTQTASGRPDLAAVLRDVYNPAILRLREMDKIAVAAVNGPAVGVGCSFALACDYVLAAKSAYFLLAFVNIGLVLDGGASVLAPGRVGFTRAAEFAGLGGRLDAETAASWGLINSVHADDEVLDAAGALAARCAAGAPQAQAKIKRMLNEQCFSGLAEGLELEARLQGEQGEGDEFTEGVAAFLQKRKPHYA